MKRTWKKLFAFVCAFTLVAAPVTYNTVNADAPGSNSNGVQIGNVSIGNNSTTSSNNASVGTDYTLTIPATLNVANAGWNATGGITAQVKSDDTFDASKKLTVTAASTNNWALKSGDYSVGYNLATATGTYSSTAEPASWEFSAADLNADGGKTNPMGIIVEDYSSKPAGTYQDTVTFTAKVEDAVKAETLLTTITATGKDTYSQSVEGVVTVTLANIDYYNNQYGWLWNGTITVEPVEGYTITKCRFIQNSKTPLDDDLAPFSIDMQDDPAYYTCSVITSTGQKDGGSMDGVTSIEVYGYEN